MNLARPHHPQLPELLAVARGDRPADLVLRNARLVNVLSGEVHRADVAVAGEVVAGVGAGYRGAEEIDLGGRYLGPGWIDAHVHVESSLVPPSEFARAVVPRGVTSVITDPHEIANVCGLDGIRYMLRDAETTPLDMLINAPSCVPASALATSGARLDAAALRSLLKEAGDRILGLAEVMDFPAVVAGDDETLAKLRTFAGRVIDGHCPGLTGPALAAYAAAGISSDHECTTAEEAREKLRLGLTVFVREATNARNLEALLPAVDRWNEHRLCWCTDDRHPADLLGQGSIDHLLRTAIGAGLEPMTAIRMATLNTADHYRLGDRGAIAPGRRADLVAFSDFSAPLAERVWIGGRLVAADGRALFDRAETGYGGASTAAVRNTVHVDWSRIDFRIPALGERMRTIGVIPDQLRTESLAVAATVDRGLAVADPSRDLLKIAVVERHGRQPGNVGTAFVRGLGLQRGAIAGTVVHDHHNLIVVGADDVSMTTAARAVADAGSGGLAVAVGELVAAFLPLPIAGLMSDRPIEDVRRQMEDLLAAAGELGARVRDPFMAMSFLGLEVIPALKLTDRGLVDVERMATVPLFIDD